MTAIQHPLRHPTGFVPLILSGLALALVVGYATFVSSAPQADEGTAAHLFQLLLVLEIPVIAAFAIRWLPVAPTRAAAVLALQALAIAIALLPVYLLGF